MVEIEGYWIGFWMGAFWVLKANGLRCKVWGCVSKAVASKAVAGVECFEEAYRIRSKVFGHEHPAVTDTLKRLNEAKSNLMQK